MTTYVKTVPAYEWPLTIRYTVFPEIYGYLEKSYIIESWTSFLK